MDIKYYIRSTGERYLDESYNQIPYVELIDKERRYVAFFIEQLEKYGNEDMVIIEDDCVLCKNFKERIESVIAQYPNKIINFFQYETKKYFKTHESTEYLQNQCTYYPKGLTIKLAHKMRELLEKNPQLRTDQCEDLALKELKETHIKYRPCLVQHLNFDTFLNNMIESKRTPFFIDYLDELKIDYNKLMPFKTGMLIRKMREHIESKRIIWLEQQKNPRVLQVEENKPKKKRTAKKKVVEDGENNDKVLCENNE